MATRIREAIRRRIVSSARLARAERAGRLLLAEQRLVSGEFDQHVIEQWRTEFAALKAFMQRAFQVLTYNGIDGDYVEFGCHGGRSFALAWGAARLTGHGAHLWAFDSFEGLPQSDDPRDQHLGWTTGAMSMSAADFVATCTARGIPREAYTLVPGFYAESLRREAAVLPDVIAFVYIDCDLYTSTVEVLAFLEPRLRHGMVIACDDYYCYSAHSASGERLALAELFHEHERWRLVPYVQWSWHGMSFIVEARDAVPGGTTGW